jgi:hypothetical protein
MAAIPRRAKQSNRILPMQKRGPPPPAPATPLPANLEAERKLISDIFLNPFDFERFADIVSADFYEHRYSRIWSCLHTIYDEGGVPCLEMVNDRLYQEDALADVGGQAHLESLKFDKSAELNADYLADLVRKYSAQRRAVNIGIALSTAAMRPEFDPTIIADVRKQLDTIEAATLGVSATQLRYPVVVDSETEELPMPQGLLGNLLYEDSIAFLYAKEGRWKSFVALSWALCVATGTPWLGRAVRPSSVLYIASEGARGTGQRIRAWKVHHGLSGPSRLRVLGIPVNLLDPAAVQELIAAIRAQMEDPPALVVIDTLARSMPGGDENVTKDMNTITDSLGQIRMAFGGCCVLVVHHPGKEVAKGMRGSSALPANADTVIRIAGPNDNEPMQPGDALSIVSEKAKDGETFESISFTTQKVTWVREDSGEIGNSLVVIGSDHAPEIQAERAVIRRKPSSAERLLDMIKTHHPNGAMFSTLEKLFISQTGLTDRTFTRAIGDLQVGGDVENVSGFYRLINHGEETAK